MNRYPYLAMTANEKAAAAPIDPPKRHAHRDRRVAHHMERAIPVNPGTS